MPRLHKSTPSRSSRTIYVDFVKPMSILSFGKSYKDMKDFTRAMKFRAELAKRQDPKSRELQKLIADKEAIRNGYIERAASNQKNKEALAKAEAKKNNN